MCKTNYIRFQSFRQLILKAKRKNFPLALTFLKRRTGKRQKSGFAIQTLAKRILLEYNESIEMPLRHRSAKRKHK